jgi:hypothetical protein
VVVTWTTMVAVHGKVRAPRIKECGMGPTQPRNQWLSDRWHVHGGSQWHSCIDRVAVNNTSGIEAEQ